MTTNSHDYDYNARNNSHCRLSDRDLKNNRQSFFIKA